MPAVTTQYVAKQNLEFGLFLNQSCQHHFLQNFFEIEIFFTCKKYFQTSDDIPTKRSQIHLKQHQRTKTLKHKTWSTKVVELA
jgi:hypothetical protein